MRVICLRRLLAEPGTAWALVQNLLSVNID